MIVSPVLVINSGSSSLKFSIFDMRDGREAISGLAERLGAPEAALSWRSNGEKQKLAIPGQGHDGALREVHKLLEDIGTPAAIGHRVVHGGEAFTDSVVINAQVIAGIERCASLAPLHNPANLLGIRVMQQLYPQVAQVAVFDTAFHQSLPPVAYTYALDREVAAQHQVRRYGFHGTSVAFVAGEAARLLDRDPARTNLIVLHLGNGASATAVRGGRSADTSMGLTPLEGLVMGTRSGDLDPGILFHLRREAGWSVDELDDLLNRRSGMLGLCGANDMREVQRLAMEGDADARLARDVYCYRIRRYVGAYLAVLGETHAVVFTGGVGENDAWVRSHSLAGMRQLGIEIDHVRNASRGNRPRHISPDGAGIAVLVVPTNEELEIARQSVALVT
jgi:acetate kinase